MKLLLAGAFALMIATFTPASAETIAVEVTGDTYITEHSSLGGVQSRHGGDAYLQAIGAQSYRSFPMLHFDLSPWQGRTIDGDVILQAFVRDIHPAYAYEQRVVNVHTFHSLIWDAQTVSFADVAFSTDPLGIPLDVVTPAIDGASISIANRGAYVNFTLPQALVQGWIDDPSSNHGLILVNTRNDNGGYDVVFDAKESTADTAAQLVVTLADADETPPEIITIDLEALAITTADGNGVAAVHIEATDDLSGVAEVRVDFTDPADATHVVSGSARLNGAPLQAQVSVDVAFPVTATAGQWALSGHVADAAGNRTEFRGGQGGAPIGVTVSNERCADYDVLERQGPHGEITFGMLSTRADFIYFDEALVRDLQDQLETHHGWDDELVSIDVDIRRAFCVAMSWREDALAGVEDAAVIYSLEREALAHRLDVDFAQRYQDLLALRAGLDREFLERPLFRDMLDALMTSDARNAWRYKKHSRAYKEANDAATMYSLNGILDYFRRAWHGLPKPAVTKLSIASLVLDLYHLYYDLPDLFGLISEDFGLLDQETVLQPFAELMYMRLELDMLILQYEKQYEEYEALKVKLYR